MNKVAVFFCLSLLVLAASARTIVWTNAGGTPMWDFYRNWYDSQLINHFLKAVWSRLARDPPPPPSSPISSFRTAPSGFFFSNSFNIYFLLSMIEVDRMSFIRLKSFPALLTLLFLIPTRDISQPYEEKIFSSFSASRRS